MFKRTLLLMLLMALLAPLAMHAQQTLLSENFDSMSSIATSYSATDWYAYNASSTNTNNWALSSSSPNSGTTCARYIYNSQYAADCYLVSAPFNAAANMTELDVSLYEITGGYNETFEVFFVKASDITTSEGVASATQYSAIASTTYKNTDYAEVTGSCTDPTLAGQSVRIVVHCTSAADQYYLNIDDITITQSTTDPYILLNPSSATVFTGFTKTLTATYGNVSGTPTITYTSSQPKVASVSGSGTTATVTGESVGTATITATMTHLGTDYTATCEITVENPAYCEPYFSYTNTNYGLFIDSFDTEGGITNISNDNTSLTAGGYADYYDSHSASIVVGETLSFTVTPGYTNSSGYAIWIDWNQDYEFSSDERVAVTTSMQTTAWTGTIPIASTTALGDYRMRVMLQYGTNPSNPCVSSTYGEAEDYKLTVLEVPSCDYPTALQYSEVGNRSVKLSWTENGTATSWQICINGDETHLVTANTNTNYLLEGLIPETDYTVKVRAYCDISSQSYWSNEVSFTTEVPCPAPTGFHAVDITASTANLNWTSDAGSYEFKYSPHTADSELLKYDDGTWGTNVGAGGSFYWATMFPAGSYQGNYLTKVTNYVVMEMTGYLMIYNGATTEPDNLVAIKAIEFTGGNDFVDFTFDNLIEIDKTKNLWIVFYNETSTQSPAAACVDPGDVNDRWVSFDGTTWLDLADAGVTGYGWMIRANVENISISGTANNCTANSYPLTGLTPETTYAAQVRSVCGGEDGESTWATTLFTTLSNCEAPTNLETNDVTHISATLSWSGIQEKYNVRYRTASYREPYLFDNFETNPSSTWTLNSGGWYSGIPYSGTYFVLLGYTSTETQYLITPELSGLSSGSTVEFYQRYFSSATTFKVGYSSTTGDVDAFTWGSDINATKGYTMYSEVIPDGTKYIAIQTTAAASANALLIDDFGVYSPPIAAGTWNDLAKKTSPLTIDGLTVDTYYEWQVQGLNSGCTDGTTDWSYSAYFTTEDGILFINDGNWNVGSNWYLGVVPADGSSVTIQANATIPKGYDAIADVITLDGGTITIQDGGQLHSNNAVQATVEKEIIGYTGDNDRYYLIANPLSTNVNPLNSGIASGTYDLYSFNGTLEGEEWRNYEASAFNLTGSNGYLYANADDITLQFTGSVRKQNTSSYNYISSNKLKYDATTAFGTWNLVGNLFPHNAYVYVGALVNNSLSFADEMYYYKMNDTGNEIVSTNGNEMIKPCEGVFVQSSAADQYAFFASVKRKRDSKGLNLNLTASGKLVDRATLSFDECNGLEKFQLNPNHTKVYVPVNGKDYAVTHAEEQGEMPVNFKAEKSGTYTLSFTTDNVEFNYLHLIDNITGNDVDLLATPSYTFDARYTDYAARFRLVFSKGSANGDDNFGFISNGQLILTGLTGGETLQVIDALGRLIVSTNAFNHISTENMAAGVYVLRLINGNDVKTQKIVVR